MLLSAKLSSVKAHSYSNSVCIYTAEDLEFLDTSEHIYMHMVTMHEYKTVMTAAHSLRV